MMEGFALVFLLVSSTLGQTAPARDGRVTAVAGESWLRHLHRSFDETSMGKTGHLGPPPFLPPAEPFQWNPGIARPATVTLHGSDLFRFNCRPCHGESGMGAPPEINSVINPVRATSVAAVIERMKQNGMEIGRADALTLAQQSRILLLQRLHNGGHDMPPFLHLTEAEIRSLLA